MIIAVDFPIYAIGKKKPKKKKNQGFNGIRLNSTSESRASVMLQSSYSRATLARQ